MAIANSIQAEVDALIWKLRLVSDRSKLDSRAAFRIAAKPLIAAAQARAPKSDEPHHRYLNGKKVATYYPGNLRRSIRALTFRRSDAIFVGPRLNRTGSTGDFRGARTDGYYAHMVEFGTINQRPQPFMRPAAMEAGPTAIRIATRELKTRIDKFAQKYAQVRGRE